MNRDWMARRSGRLAVAIAVALVVAGIGLWAQNDSLVGVSYDDGIYALLARSIASGEGYRLTYLPQALPGIKYPPVYPLALAPFWTLAGSQETALSLMKLANGVVIGLAAGLFLFLLADLGLLSLPLAAGVTLAGFAAGSIMLVTTGLLSEPLYLLLLFVALLLADRTGREAGLARLLIVGFAAGLVALTRTVGIAAVAAVLIGMTRRSAGRRWIVAAAAAALAIVPWALFSVLAADEVPSVLVPRYGSYIQFYLASLAGTPSMAVEIFAINSGAILETLGAKLIPGSSSLMRTGAGTLLLGLAALGSRRAFVSAPSTAVYPWFYLALIAVWSFPPFRFLFILFPLLLALAAVGLVALARAWGERARASGARGWRALGRPAVAGVGIVALVYLGYREARSIRERVWDGAQLQKSYVAEEVIDWVRAHTAPDAVVAYEFEPLIALHTGRMAVPNNYAPIHVWYERGPLPTEPLARLIREMGVAVLAVRRDVPAAAAPIDALIGRHPGLLDLVEVTAHGALIFRTHPGPADGRPRDRGSSSSGVGRVSSVRHER